MNMFMSKMKEIEIINGDIDLKLKQMVSQTVNNVYVSKENDILSHDCEPINGLINGNCGHYTGQQLLQPFPTLSGESILFSGSTTEGVIILTNFRLFLSLTNTKDGGVPISLPIAIIDAIELRDLYYLYIYTKYIRSFICSFASGEECLVWHKRLNDTCLIHLKFENLFCSKFFMASKIDNSKPFIETKHIRDCWDILSKEHKRMNFDANFWRISDTNKDFKLCSSYPRYIIVPSNICDKDLEMVANFRYSRRIPTVVWRYNKNGCIIARSSQPEVGWLGWRSSQDEHLLQSLITSCTSNNEIKNKKLLVLDARSYTAAVANRAKGGGCECQEYYMNCEVQFMSLANIHSIRKSSHAIRYICEPPADQFNWLTLLDNSKWLNNISGLMKSALIVVNAIDIEERPVLVHCSDGWDRTPQIVSLAELMLDPYYRTFDGFQILIEREWIQFGHKFADRSGHGSCSEDTNERCPVFLQWLDCVHQLVRQFPCSFEFNLQFLIKLIHHTYSCLFGTFICNNMHERISQNISERTYSVWSYFNTSRQQFINYVYLQNDQVLRPSCRAKDIIFWSDVYTPLSSSSISGAFLTTVSPNICNGTNGTIESDISRTGKDSESDSKCHIESDTSGLTNETNETESDMDTIASDKHHSLLSKTRSCENIALDDDYKFNFNDISIARARHCSDPNLFRTLNLSDGNGKGVDILNYLRDLQLTACSDSNGDCNQRDNDNDNDDSNDSNDNDNETALHFSMLSTETLLNTNPNASYVENNYQICCNNKNIALSNLFTTSTSTSELSNSNINNTDITVQFDKYHSSHCQRKKQAIISNSIQRHNSTELNGFTTTNGKHNRTPSSGCPATPSDDSYFDNLIYDNLTNNDIFDIDGHVLSQDKAFLRLQQIMANRVANSTTPN